jgi:hypothetical protein
MKNSTIIIISIIVILAIIGVYMYIKSKKNKKEPKNAPAVEWCCPANMFQNEVCYDDATKCGFACITNGFKCNQKYY